MFNALNDAVSGIPVVKRFHIGRRIKHGRSYEAMMRDDYPYAAVIEFDDMAGLTAYLNHPRHETLGRLFFELWEAGLVYDYEMNDALTFLASTT